MVSRAGPPLLAATLFACGPAVVESPSSDNGVATYDTSGAPGEISTGPNSGGSTGEPPAACSPAPDSCAGCETMRVEYEGEAGLDDGFNDIALLPGGDIITVGVTNRERDYLSPVGDAIVVRYAPDGTPVWSRTFPDERWQTHALSVEIDQSGQVIVATQGHASGSAPEFEVRLLALNAEGADMWPDPIVLPQRALVGLVSSNGELWVPTHDPIQETTATIGKLHVDGTLETVLDVGTLGEPGAVPTSLAVPPDGGLIVGGHRPPERPWIVSVDPTGSVRWTTQTFPDAEYGWISDLVLDTEGAIIYAVIARDGGSGVLPVVGKLDAEGVSVWSQIHSAGGCCTGGFEELALDPQGRLFAGGGLVLDGGGRAARVTSIDPCSGAELWTWLYEEGDRTVFFGGMAVSPNGITVAGHLATIHPNGRAWWTHLDL